MPKKRKTEDFERFKALTNALALVPKSEVEKEEAKYRRAKKSRGKKKTKKKKKKR